VLQQPRLKGQRELGEYWTLLKDPVLDELIKRGVDSSPSLREALFRIDESRARYGIARGTYLPDVDLEGEVRKRRRSEAVASAIDDPNDDFLSVGGSLSWELDVLGRVRRLNESAKASFQASIDEYYGVQVSLQAEIAASYIRYRTIESQVVLTKKNIELQRESLSLARERAVAGVAPELDVQQAESNLGQTEAALPLLRIALTRQRNTLGVLTGEHSQGLVSLLESSGQIPRIEEFDRDSLPLDILRQRPDIRQAERELAAQHALIGVAEAELYPIISLPGEFSFEALNMLEDAFDSGSRAYTIGPAIRWNFLDFGRTRNNIRVQDARMKQRLEQYRQRVLLAVKEVEDALVTQREERIRAKHLRRSVKASRRSAALVRELYASGLTDFQNVLDSERRLFEQEIGLSQSEGNSVEAVVALFRALGGGWQNLAVSEAGAGKNAIP
jgi:NodT family efflux transporter outer membrane factor (OMF) lipoprotein